MTMEVLAVVVVVMFFLIDLITIAMWWKERSVWTLEKKDLLNRLMVKDWPSYVALQQVEEKISHEAAPAEVELTSDYDKAWAG